MLGDDELDEDNLHDKYKKDFDANKARFLEPAKDSYVHLPRVRMRMHATGTLHPTQSN